jgi:hypothetical protein
VIVESFAEVIRTSSERTLEKYDCNFVHPQQTQLQIRLGWIGGELEQSNIAGCILVETLSSRAHVTKNMVSALLSIIALRSSEECDEGTSIETTYTGKTDMLLIWLEVRHQLLSEVVKHSWGESLLVWIQRFQLHTEPIGDGAEVDVHDVLDLDVVFARTLGRWLNLIGAFDGLVSIALQD